MNVHLHSDHEDKPDGCIDIVVSIDGQEVIRWPYADDGVISYVEETRLTDGATDALDKIAKMCGCPQWDYPGQVVRDVECLHGYNARLVNVLGELARHDPAVARKIIRVSREYVRERRSADVESNADYIPTPPTKGGSSQ